MRIIQLVLYIYKKDEMFRGVWINNYKRELIYYIAWWVSLYKDCIWT